MGLFKAMLLVSGVPVRPSTKRERFQRDSVALQAEQNDLLEEQIFALEQMNQLLKNNRETNMQGIKAPTGSSATNDNLELIGRLHKLWQEGVLTDDEYETQRKHLIKKLSS